MADPLDARKYLEDALPNGSWAAASRALSRADSYVQQYIKYGKPRWLAERDRDILVEMYSLDEERLKPPPKPLRRPTPKNAGRNSDNQSQIDSQRDGEVIDDPRTFQLLEIWGRITRNDRRDLALRILGTLADTAESVVA